MKGFSYTSLGTAIGELVDRKQTEYGDSFGKAGGVLRILYPDGIQPAAYDDMLAVVRVVDKLFRVANGSKGTESPGRDIAGYGLLLAKRHEQRK